MIEAVYGDYTGPDYSNDDVYAEYLVQTIEGKIDQNAPNFSDDKVYEDYLVKVILD